jgi:hypothetical protein
MARRSALPTAHLSRGGAQWYVKPYPVLSHAVVSSDKRVISSLSSPSLYQPLKVLQPVDGEDSQYNFFLNGSPSLFSLCLNPDSLNYSGVLYWNVTDDTFAQTCTPIQLALESV